MMWALGGMKRTLGKRESVNKNVSALRYTRTALPTLWGPNVSVLLSDP